MYAQEATFFSRYFWEVSRFKIDITAFQDSKLEFHIFLAKTSRHAVVSLTSLMKKWGALWSPSHFPCCQIPVQSYRWREHKMFVNLVLVLLWLTFTVYLFKIMLNKKAFTTYVFAIILWTIIHYQGELHMSTNGLISNVCTISSIFCLLILNAQALAKESISKGKKI